MDGSFVETVRMEKDQVDNLNNSIPELTENLDSYIFFDREILKDSKEFNLCNFKITEQMWKFYAELKKEIREKNKLS